MRLLWLSKMHAGECEISEFGSTRLLFGLKLSPAVLSLVISVHLKNLRMFTLILSTTLGVPPWLMTSQQDSKAVSKQKNISLNRDKFFPSQEWIWESEGHFNHSQPDVVQSECSEAWAPCSFHHVSPDELCSWGFTSWRNQNVLLLRFSERHTLDQACWSRI